MTVFSGKTRTEHDSLGDVEVPVEALWRAQTQRAVDNFPISGEPIPAEVIHAIAQIKAAAAAVNVRHDIIDQATADAIIAAAALVAAGDYDAQFPIDVFQTGSGTSTNMNTNEVIASLAQEHLGKSVHANDQVNASQSSNDVFPSAIHIAATNLVLNDLIPALEQLAASLQAKADQWQDVVKAGRTHLMDAAPTTLGTQFSGYAAQVNYAIERLRDALPRVAELPLGGTAVGTGINAPAGFGDDIAAQLAQNTGLPLTEARNHAEAHGARDSLVELSGALRTLAISLTKIAEDIRWMGSGPHAGLGELELPTLQPGSSIMPGKVNPVIPEAILQIAAAVVGNDATIAWGGARGNFELNVQLPVIARALVHSLKILAGGSRVFATSCIDGLIANVEKQLFYAEGSSAIVTPLATVLGYEEAAAIVKQAMKEKKTLRQVAIDRGHVANGTLTEAQLDEALDVAAMAKPPQR